MREYGSNINLPSLDNLFSSEQERQDAKLEKIQIFPLTELHPFRNHPFQVRDDDEMDKMVDSIKEYGVMTPAIVRPRKDGGYEIVAGHRRCHASQRAGVETMPCIVRDMDDDTAIILMVDSNCQREHILPSEKAKAYQMKLEAVKRKAGRPSKNNSAQVGPNLWASEKVAADAGESRSQVKRFIALNNLTPALMQKMDLDVQLTRLKTLKAAHDSQRYELENKIAIGFPAEIRKCKEQIENATVDAATVKEHSVVDADGKDVFCIQLEKKVYYEKEPAGKALLGLLGLALNSEKPVPIGYFKGMELQIQHLPFGNEYHARLASSGTYSTQLGADVLGNLTRLSNLANGIEPSIEKTRNMQIQLEQQLASAEEEVKRPFPQATELTEKSKRLAVLEGLLNMNDKDIVTDTEPEQQCQTDNRQRGQGER